jgi:hypothetical protein
LNDANFAAFIKGLVEATGEVIGGSTKTVAVLIDEALTLVQNCDCAVVGDAIFLTPTDLRNLDVVDIQKTIRDTGSDRGLLCNAPVYDTAITISRLDKPSASNTVVLAPNSSLSLSSLASELGVTSKFQGTMIAYLHANHAIRASFALDAV